MNKLRGWIFYAVLLLIGGGCRTHTKTDVGVETIDCGKTEKGELFQFRLSNGKGTTVSVTNWGAALMDVSVPDKRGNLASVVLGFDSARQYRQSHPKFGSVVGRYANRIAGASLELDGVTYALDRNQRNNCIHGGAEGFHRQLFQVDTAYVSADTAVVRMSYLSRHLEGGFPGNLQLEVAYKLNSRNEVILEYTATTDRPTVINLTNHSYFNLSGGERDVLAHRYRIVADSVTPVDSAGIPTGERMAVEGTEYDFRQADSLVARMDNGASYDINYVLDKGPGTLSLAAVVEDPASGRILKAYTTEPGMQFYVPKTDMGKYGGRNGKSYGRYYGFCLEMQHYPDAPHHPAFPSTVLRPGEVYRQVTVYRFETEGEGRSQERNND